MPAGINLLYYRRCAKLEDKILTPPLTDEQAASLKVGEQVYFTGTIYTARDAAHKKLVDLITAGEPLPFDLTGQVIYYVGPSPAKPGKPIGSAGPTTSYRMDAYTPKLIENGLKGMIGKGSRDQTVIDAMVKNKAVYFAAVGGAAALIAKTVTKAEVIAYPELGPEAIFKLEVEKLPVIVVNDVSGEDLYELGKKQYARN
ncbi:MAG: Fe-S-containing hydro-lyase [Clostridia bacterium]|nr:Fe-S-containing hydro-lyase [Clostridia bacterium]